MEESSANATGQVRQVQSQLHGILNGNEGNYNVYGEGNTVYNIQTQRDTTHLGGTNEECTSRGCDRGPSAATRPCWIVPYCRNVAFTGRKGILESMIGFCKSGAHNRVALHGLGGCGKTQLALEYVYQRASETNCHVFWVQGSGILKFSDGFRAIAQHVQIPLASPENDEEESLRCVRTWFEGPDSGDWILIIDNADNDADFIGNTSPIAKFVPQGRRGTVLFTTRSQQVAVRQGCRIISVGGMAAEEAVELFSKRFSSWGSLQDEERRVVAMILDSVDNLPLAVVGVAAFMAENGTSPSVYWNMFCENDDRTKALLSKEFCDIQREVGVTESILSTYFITFDRIKEQMPPAAELLRLIAFFDRQNIPQKLLTHSGLEGMDDSLKFCEAIGKLLRFALVSEVNQEGTTFYELHRLVQLSIQVYLPIEEAKQWRAAALGATLRLFPVYEYKRQHICAAYMSHALLLTKDSTDPAAERLAYRMGWHFMQMGSYNNAEIQARRCIAPREAGGERDWDGEYYSRIMLAGIASRDRGRVKEAEALNRQALEGYEKAVGPDNPYTLWACNNLALVLERQGRYEESEATNRRALEGYEKVLGPDNPNTLLALNNLALVLRSQGRYKESEMMNRRALGGYEKALGPENPSTLAAAGNLAILLERQGRYNESEVVSRRTLEGYKKALGADNPDTLLALNNLALVLQCQGRYEESEAANRRALEGYEKAVGSDHPDTLSAVNNLATVLRIQGRYKESEVMGRRALDGYKKVLGTNHPDTLSAVDCLAIVLESRGRYEESEVMKRQALEGYERALGSDHPNTLSAVNNLAVLLRIQGRSRESEVMNRRASEGYEKALGPGHPNTLLTLNNLAIVLRIQGSYEESEVMNRRALEGYEKALGLDHPDTLSVVNSLAIVLESRGRYEESEAMNRRALEGYKKALGPDHPKTLSAVSNLAVLLRVQGRYEESEALNQRALEGFEKALGSDHPSTLAAAHNLTTVRESRARCKESGDESTNGRGKRRLKLGGLHLAVPRIWPTGRH